MPLLSGKGNAVSARRIAELLSTAGFEARAIDHWHGEDARAMVVLNSWRSASVAHAFHARFPHRPLVAVLTGTDIFPAFPSHPDVPYVLSTADAIVAWHEESVAQLPPVYHDRTHVIWKSALDVPSSIPDPPETTCRVLIAGHLRDVKDPFRGAAATLALPVSSRVKLIHAGEALTDDMACDARHWMQKCPRYEWLGNFSRAQLWQEMARTRYCLNSSWAEGGANAVIESICCGRPVIASHIPGNTGLLGRNWPALFPAGDTASLTVLLRRCEDPDFYQHLRELTRTLALQFTPEAETSGWIKLLRHVDVMA